MSSYNLSYKKKLRGLFGEEFTLKMVNDINSSTGYVKDVKLQSLPADHDESDEEFHLDEPAKKSDYLSSGVKTINGTIYHNGYPCYIGDDAYRLGIYKSTCGLVVLQVYSLVPDDLIGAYAPKIKGYVILNKDLKIVYENLHSSYACFHKKQAFYDFLHDYGPAALRFVDLEDEDFDITTLNTLRRVYNLRQQTLKDNGMDPDKIAEEKEKFNKAFNILKEEYQKIQENNELNAGK